MSDEKKVITVDDFDHRLMVNGLNNFRNDLILKVIDATTKKEKKKADREGR